MTTPRISLDRRRALIDGSASLTFAPDGTPTELRALLSDLEDAEADVEQLLAVESAYDECCERLRADLAAAQSVVLSLSRRVVAQSELLAKRAEKALPATTSL